MKDAFARDFEATLKKSQWPGKDVTLDGQLEREWSAGIKKLLELQEPELQARDNQTIDNMKAEDPLVLLPLEVMAKPLELRFKYHFEGDRPTNKLDKVISGSGISMDKALTRTARVLSVTHYWFAKYLRWILCSIFTAYITGTFQTVESST